MSTDVGSSAAAIAANVGSPATPGASNSSNSNRLREIGSECGVTSYLVEDAGSIDLNWFEGIESVGISAGASTPEELVLELIERMRGDHAIELEVLAGIEEHIQFKLPEELRQVAV